MHDSDVSHCPVCTSDKVVLSRRKSFFERSILPIIGWRPYRCAACQHRFYRRMNPANEREAPEPVREKEAQLFGH
jgi:hypothetical protein